MAFCGWCVHMYFVAQKHNLKEKEKLCYLITSDFCLYRVICQKKCILWTFKSDMWAVRNFKCVRVKQTRVWNQQPDTFGEMRASLFVSVVASSNKLNMTSFCSKGVQEQESTDGVNWIPVKRNKEIIKWLRRLKLAAAAVSTAAPRENNQPLEHIRQLCNEYCSRLLLLNLWM